MKNLKFLLFFFIAFAFISCATSKSFYKKGIKLDEAGMSEEAAEMYMKSLAKKNTNVNSKIALKKTGQRALNEKLDDFNKSHMLEDHDQAVYEFEIAKLFFDRVDGYGIKLELPNHYKERYESSVVVYKEQLYIEGVTLYEAKNYSEATRKFNKISGYDPTYKDIQDYKVLTFAEPLYEKGMLAYEREEWRKAYKYFDQIHKKNPEFRDVTELWQSSLDYGTFPVAVVPFEHAPSDKAKSEKLHSSILGEITSIDNPFVKVVDRENIDQLIEEQTLGLSGVVEEGTAAQVGKILGAKGMITGEILNYSQSLGRLKKKTVQAFEAYQVTVKNEETGKEEQVTKYKPAKYFDYYNKNEITFSVQYKCTSLETGQIIFSKVYEKTTSDEIHYAVFNGEGKKLVPSKDGQPTTRRQDYDALQSLLRAKKTLLTPEELISAHYDGIGTELAKEIEDYLDF